MICSPITILLNVLILFIFCKQLSCMKHSEKWFVAAISFSDMMCGFAYAISTLNVDSMPIWLCKPYFAIVWFFSICSVVFLLLLNVNKFITLFMPYSFHILVTRRTVYLEIWTVIILILTFSSFSSWQLKLVDDANSQCRAFPNMYLHIIMLITFYMCPLLVSFVISLSIFLLAQSKSKSKNSYKKMFKRILFVFSYTIWVSITVLPYRITYCKYAMCIYNSDYHQFQAVPLTLMNPMQMVHELMEKNLDEKECLTATFEKLLYTFLCLLPLESMINPIITIATQKHYRNFVSQMFQSIKQLVSCKEILNGQNAAVCVYSEDITIVTKF